MTHEDLESIAHALVVEGKGLLAADESLGTIKRRFEGIGLESTEETRRIYRELLFTTSGVEQFISGVILFDETLRQSTRDGIPFVQVLLHKGIFPGIKVDQGAKDLAGFPGEKVTEGLDGLRERLNEYRLPGARFTKWRAVITIGDNRPSLFCLEANAHALARYAALSQEAQLVPIIEPEVLMDGQHTIDRCFEVTEATLKRVFIALSEHHVMLEGMLLKPNMILSGKDCPVQAGVEEVAQATVCCLRRAVPAAVPGIVFLSGGQSPERATAHLNAINAMGKHPWEISFSFARALQEPPLKLWKGSGEKIPEAQKAFYRRARLNSAARFGKYNKEMEEGA